MSFPQTMGFPWRFFSCLAYRIMLGVCGWALVLFLFFFLLNVGDLLLNKYLRNSFACGGNVAMRYDNIYLLSPLLPGRYSF